jgi:hypothetical protein
MRHQTQRLWSEAESLSPVRPAPRRNPADLRRLAEAMLRDMAYAYHLTRSVRDALTNAATAGGRACDVCLA